VTHKALSYYKSLSCKPSDVSLNLPFIPTRYDYYDLMQLFLATYWPLGEIELFGVTVVTRLKDSMLLVEQRGIEPLTSALRNGLSAKR